MKFSIFTSKQKSLYIAWACFRNDVMYSRLGDFPLQGNSKKYGFTYSKLSKVDDFNIHV